MKIQSWQKMKRSAGSSGTGGFGLLHFILCFSVKRPSISQSKRKWNRCNRRSKHRPAVCPKLPHGSAFIIQGKAAARGEKSQLRKIDRRENLFGKQCGQPEPSVQPLLQQVWASKDSTIAIDPPLNRALSHFISLRQDVLLLECHQTVHSSKDANYC